MIGTILKKSLLITIVIHILLVIVFMMGFIVDKETYGDDYLEHAIHFNFMFLQFVPLTFAGVFFVLLAISLLQRRKSPKR